jgi:hypothetical protein
MKTGGSQETAAAKAGMDAKTVRKYRRMGHLPSELPVGSRWRTRPDPFAKVWAEICELLESNAGLEAKTVFEFLQRRAPGEFEDGQLRTLQRQVKNWRATEGPVKEVFFAQEHPPGRSERSVSKSLKRLYAHDKIERYQDGGDSSLD